MEALGFEYRGSYETSLDDDANYSYTQEYGSNNVRVLSGFDFSFEMSNYTNIDEPKPVKIDNVNKKDRNALSWLINQP